MINATQLEPGVYHFQHERVKGTMLLTPALYNALEGDALGMQFEEHGGMGSFRNRPFDESSAAYKDVDEVIKAVVTPGVAGIVNRLRPVLVLKGE